jgi:hypothetical protein
MAEHPGDERYRRHDEQEARAVHQRHATLIAAELIRQRDHLAEAARRGGEECAGRIERGAEAQIKKDHAPDHHDVRRQRRQAGQPAERALEPVGRESRAEHRPEHRDHRPAQLLRHAQVEPGEAGRGGRGERTEQPRQGQTERGETRAPAGAKAERRQSRRPTKAAAHPMRDCPRVGHRA